MNRRLFGRTTEFEKDFWMKESPRVVRLLEGKEPTKLKRGRPVAPVSESPRPSTEIPKLLTLKEAALALRTSIDSIRALIYEGRLDAQRVRSRVFVRASDLVAYLDQEHGFKHGT